MAFLELTGISKYFGRAAAVENVDLAVDQGEFLTLLGPSGCGKTTILRMVAGFEVPDEGRVLLGGEDITRRAANRRPMGMVFQAYALFPHMTASQNIAFGMRLKKLPKEQIAERCATLLELVGLGDKGQSYPHQLSGGQQQRIALARALAIEPKVLLLDEPLSALDAKVRVSLRDEIRRIQQQLKMTAIYVTHDQEEALAISDRIAVMAKGHIEQLDYPEEIYSRPRTAFAATFVGNSNRFQGVLTSAAEGLFTTEGYTLHVGPSNLGDTTSVLVLVRPEKVDLFALDEDGNAPTATQAENQIEGVIDLRTFLGPFTRFHVQINEQASLIADIPNQQARDLAVAQRVVVSFPASACQVLPLEGQADTQAELSPAPAGES